MIDEQEYEKLKRRITLLEREEGEAAGALKEIKRALKEEFGCNTIKAAQKLLDKLEKEVAEKERIFKREYKKFNREYGPFLKALERGDSEAYRKIPDSLVAKGKGKERSKKTKARGNRSGTSSKASSRNRRRDSK